MTNDYQPGGLEQKFIPLKCRGHKSAVQMCLGPEALVILVLLAMVVQLCSVGTLPPSLVLLYVSAPPGTLVVGFRLTNAE